MNPFEFKELPNEKSYHWSPDFIMCGIHRLFYIFIVCAAYIAFFVFDSLLTARVLAITAAILYSLDLLISFIMFFIFGAEYGNCNNTDEKMCPDKTDN